MVVKLICLYEKKHHYIYTPLGYNEKVRLQWKHAVITKGRLIIRMSLKKKTHSSVKQSGWTGKGYSKI